MPGEHIRELKKWMGELVGKGKDGEFLGLNRAVDLISKHYSIQLHEVAIFVLTTDHRFLKFIIPERLQTVGQLPMTSTSSLAVRTAREKRPEVINHFAVVPHSSVFEAVPIAEEQRGDPIQKIMSAPLAVDKKVIGVIQVPRKGKSAAEAGPDLTQQELRELRTIAESVAPYIASRKWD